MRPARARAAPATARDPHRVDEVQLPPLSATVGEGVEAVLAARRSRRSFADAPVSSEQLARLLWAAQGISGPEGERTAPSAGRRYPLGAFVAVGSVTGVPCGVNRYRPDTHSLAPVASGDRRGDLGAAAIDEQPWVGRAPAVLAIDAELRGIVEHFAAQPPSGVRGRRSALLEAGAAAQNVLLVAEALGLGAVLVAGFDDDGVAAALDLPDGREPLALVAVGTCPARGH